MTTTVHRLTLPLVFPEGISMGASRERNSLVLATDGTDRPVLRGSALAGALRGAWVRAHSEEDARRWFGRPVGDAASDDGGTPSPLRVPDSTIDGGNMGVVVRSHNARDRHTGAVVDGGLFTVASCAPGARATPVLWLHASEPDSRAFLAQLVGLFDAGLTLGGAASRGVGRAVVDRSGTGPRYRSFELTRAEDLGSWLDEHRAWRAGLVPEQGEPVTPIQAPDRQLRVRLRFGVPRGQDVLVGDGMGLDHDVEPQMVVDADGKQLWRLPGSAVRGALRSWVARLASREGQRVADSALRHDERVEDGVALDGDDLAWGFENDRAARDRYTENPELVPCPVMRLFGSAYAKGRVHVTDALCASGDLQTRVHVAIDRISGGANEGLLFDNQVLTGAVEFVTTMTVSAPSDDEARWLATAVRAIDMGLIRIGSSKSTGRLCLRAVPEASGQGEEHFTRIHPLEMTR
jgi:CRISPR/Cas system CSM-associated protein Csm3 (group 7 of RAMP superfamily)